MRPLIGVTCAADNENNRSLLLQNPIFFLNQSYISALSRAGAVPLIIPILDLSEISGYVELLDGLLITGGGNVLPPEVLREPKLPDLQSQQPRRYVFEQGLIRAALDRDMPVLGICRGHQMINEVSGGSLYLRISMELPSVINHQQGEIPGHIPTHKIKLLPGTKLQRLLGVDKIATNSFHLQAVKEVGDGFVVSAQSEDGVVEAIESTMHRFVMGLQFHPELHHDQPVLANIFNALVDEAQNYRQIKCGMVSNL
ncbi:hypothetical protein SY88_14775 [Clostridiales bacterium PH28_bin88]|nr:hypothetical protein SY88_14775 [Clostridiales bacterium PH28_bin88]